MSQMIREALKDVTFNVLEMMFFAIPELRENNEPTSNDVEGSIELTGEKKISLLVLFPKELGLSLASNFLGLAPEDVSDEQLLDLTREMINMVGGNLLTNLGDEKFSLGLPDSRMVSNVSARETENKIVIQLNEHPLTIIWDKEDL